MLSVLALILRTVRVTERIRIVSLSQMSLQNFTPRNFCFGSGTDGKACPQLRQLFPEAATGGYKVGNQFPRNSVRGRQIAIRRWVAWFTNAWRKLTIES